MCVEFVHYSKVWYIMKSEHLRWKIQGDRLRVLCKITNSSGILFSLNSPLESERGLKLRLRTEKNK